MKAFADLYAQLDASTATGDKRAALVDYFARVPAADASWAVWLLSGGKVGGARADCRHCRTAALAGAGQRAAGLARR